jgi:hypothetical protein
MKDLSSSPMIAKEFCGQRPMDMLHLNSPQWYFNPFTKQGPKEWKLYTSIHNWNDKSSYLTTI